MPLQRHCSECGRVLTPDRRRTCNPWCGSDRAARLHRARRSGELTPEQAMNVDRGAVSVGAHPPPLTPRPSHCQHCQEGKVTGSAYVTSLKRSHWLCEDCGDFTRLRGELPFLRDDAFATVEEVADLYATPSPQAATARPRDAKAVREKLNALFPEVFNALDPRRAS